jgi:UDP-2,3-diacylglucosamine hydrolase
LETLEKIYFISDVHLGLYPEDQSLEREKLVVKWLDTIKDQTSELYLVGDIFDFWHEYKYVVPKGYSRFIGKLADLSDRGIKIYFFSGNHDVWSYGYFQTEFGAEIFHEPLIKNINGLNFFIHHGDGLGPGDYGYKILIRCFRSKTLQWMFSRLHPNFALWIGTTWSKNSRYSKGIVGEPFAGEEKELQIIFAKQMLKKKEFDFFIFGHRHTPYDIKIGDKTRVINLGDWINNFTYAELDGQELKLKSFQGYDDQIIRKE